MRSAWCCHARSGRPVFGELSALLAVAILAGVPGVALQAGVARGIASAPTGDRRRGCCGSRRSWRGGRRCAADRLAAAAGWPWACARGRTWCCCARSWCRRRCRSAASACCRAATSSSRSARCSSSSRPPSSSAGVYAALTRTGISGALSWTAVLTAGGRGGRGARMIRGGHRPLRLHGVAGVDGSRGWLVPRGPGA